MQTDATYWFDRLVKPEQSEAYTFKAMDTGRDPEKPQRDWMFLKLPAEIRNPLKAWARQFCRSVEGASPVSDLHITLFHHLVNSAKNRRRYDAIAGRNAPCEILLSKLLVFRTEKGNAVVVEVISQALENLRWELQSEIEHVPSLHNFKPHITIAYIPHEEGIELDGMVVPGIDGLQCVVEEIHFEVGGKVRSSPLVAPVHGYLNRRFEKSDGTIATKSGMSTLSGEAGGFLMGPAKKRAAADFIKRALTLANRLEKEYGDADTGD